MWYPVASLRSTSSGEFTRFWGGLYKYDNPELYDRNIGKLLTRERVLDLFAWKNGRRLSERKMQTVERHFLSRLAENADFSDDSKAKDFLEQYDSDGVIWRIFFLHICLPEKFPIFDQHVYRAMKAIQTGTPMELPNAQRRIVAIYLNDYCPFHADMGGIGRQVDKALWTFGRFIKAYRSLGSWRSSQVIKSNLR